MSAGPKSIQALEDIDQIEKVWEREKRQIAERRHPNDFPALPSVPVSRYVDPVFFEIEKQHLWRKTWVLAGFSNEIEKPGSYKSLDIAGSPIFILRDDQGDIRAFHNACQHRGTAVCLKPQGQVERFRCPYHGWTYDLAGQLIHVPQEHEFPGLDRHQKGLKPLRCERLGNLIFVSFDENAPALAAYLEDLAELWTDVPFDRVELHETVSMEMNCNWKCVHDNFNETYHVPSVHPKTVHVALDFRCHAKHLFKNGYSAMYTKIRGGKDSGLYRSGGAEISTLKPLTAYSSRAYCVFPSLVMPVADNVFTIIESVPITVSRSRLNVHFMKITGTAGVDLEALAREAVAVFKPIAEEDAFLLEYTQKSMAGGGLDAISLSYSEQFLYNYQLEIDNIIGRDNIPERYRVGIVELPLKNR